MLATEQITAMRLVLDASLPNDVAILRYQAVTDGQGGETRAYTTVATVRGRLSRSTRMVERVVGGKTSAVVGYELVLPAGTDLRPRDRARVGGATYEVTETDAGSAEAVAVSAMVWRVT